MEREEIQDSGHQIRQRRSVQFDGRTASVPVRLDKEDDRNIVTVNYDRDGNYSDDYMLVAVREETEKVIQKYLESLFWER